MLPPRLLPNELPLDPKLFPLDPKLLPNELPLDPKELPEDPPKLLPKLLPVFDSLLLVNPDPRLLVPVGFG